MANEFIARKGLIVPSGSILVGTGSITASNFLGTASIAVSSSHATTASFALNAVGSGFPFSGSAVITGSLDVTQAVTASFFKGDGSQLTNINVGTAVVRDVYTFSGDGITQLYVLSQSYYNKNIQVNVDGLTFTEIVDYSYDTGSILFVTVPPSSSNILVTALLNTSDNLTGSFTGSFIGLVTSASYAETASYALNGGLVSSSTQIDYNSIQNKLSGVVSSSAQVAPLLPNGTVSSSNQINITTTTGYTTFSSSLATVDATQQTSINALNAATSSYAINSTIQSQLAGVVSSSTQVKPLLPVGTVTSSAQYPGWVTASSQIDYNSIQNKLSGVVSSSTQVKPLLPAGTVSSSGQVDITVTTGYSTFSSSLATVDVGQNVRIDNLASLTSSYAINSTIQTQLAGVVSSSAQVKPLLPVGTVTSSAQYPGWVTASSQIDYNSIQNKLSGVVSSSVQVQPLLPANTVSSSAQVKTFLPVGTVTSSAQYPGWVTASSQIVVQNTTGIGAIATTGSNTFTGIQTVNNTTNSTAFNNGAVVIAGGLGVTKDVNISGSLTVTGLLTAVSMSTQYVTSSEYTIGTSRILLNDDDVVRFAGLSVIDSGSSNATASILWDSLKNHFIYETDETHGGDEDHSAILLAGPETYAGVGNESELILGRIPVATSDHNLDNRIASSSIRIDFPTRLTHIEAGVVVTGSTTTQNLTATGTVLLAGVVSSSAQIDYNSIQNKLSGVVSSSAQVKPLLPVGTVTSSAQYPGWVTASSQIDYNLIQNKLSGVVSSSVQVQPLLPAGTVSSSGQVDYNSIQNKLSGVVSSSAQVKPLLPVGTVTSSAQFPGWVTASSQIDYNNIQNKLSGVVSSSAQVQPLLPASTVSSSGQVTITATTGYSTFSSSISTVDTGQTARIDNLASLTSSYAINSTIQSQLAGVVSSSAQVKPLLPGGTVTSSAQYPGWVTSSAQIDYNSIQNKLSGVVSSSAQVKPLLPGGTVTSSAQFPGWVTASSQIDYNSIQNKLSGVVSSSAQVVPLLPNGTVSSSGQVTITATTGYSTFSSSISTVDTEQTLRINNLASLTSSYAINSTIQSQLAGVVSSSTQIKPLLPGGTVTSSAQFPGWVTSSAQIDYNSIQNKLSGVVSSSAQVKPLLPGGTVSSSAQVAINSTTGTLNVNTGGTGQTSYVNGELLIGNTTGNTLSKATLTGTANRILITNGTGSITINADADSANTVNKIVARDASGNFAGGTITANTLIVGTQAAKATISYATNTARTLTIPSLDGNRTFAFIDQAQTISAAQTFSATPLTLSAATAVLTFSSATGNKTISTAANTNLILSPGGTGNVGINTTTPNAKLSVSGSANITGSLDVSGAFTAQTKSFKIQHPTIPEKQLVYGSLESPYHGVRLTGEGVILNGEECVIHLPDYITGLCKQEGAQVQLTNVMHGKVLWIQELSVTDNYFIVACDRGMFDTKQYKFYWSFTGIRKDVEPLQTVV